MGTNENVFERFQKWRDSIEAGKKGFEQLVGGLNGCYYHRGPISRAVDTAIVCTMDDSGVIFCHQWNKGTPLDGGKFFAIIKDREKLLVIDKDSGGFASGMSDADGSDVARAILYFRCGDIATFVVASSDIPVIHIVDYLYGSEKLEKDPLHTVLYDLLNRLPRKEVASDAGPQVEGSV